MTLFITNTYGFVHIVGRGETLSTIAKTYNVPVSVIIKANPGCENKLYAGTKLQIPLPNESGSTQSVPVEEHQVSQSEVTQQQQITTIYPNIDQVETSIYTTQIIESSENEGMFEKEILAGLSMNNYTGKNAEYDFKPGFHIGITGRYIFPERFFVEGSLRFATKGYKKHNSDSSGQYWDDNGPNYDSDITIKMTSYNLDFIPSIGYKIAVGTDANLLIKVGPYITYALSGKRTYKGSRTNYDTIHSSDIDPIDDKDDFDDLKNQYRFKSFGYGIQGGLGLEINQLMISASYQHGLSKIFGKSKVYEQNILVSIGYVF